MTYGRAISYLRNAGHLDWNTLFVGWRRGWATRADVAEAAIHRLSEFPDEADHRLLELAAGETLQDSEYDGSLASFVQALAGSLPDERNSVEVDKWRLAHLCEVSESKQDSNARQERLEYLYAEFDYPQDMAPCSRYYLSQSQVQQGWSVGDREQSPLEVMEIVRRNLAERLRDSKVSSSTVKG